MSDNDSPCNSYTPHSYLYGSSLGEQGMAGVQLYEDPFSAAAKVEIYRRNNGLDIYTGMPVQRQDTRHPVSSGRYYGGAAAGHVAIADSPADARGETRGGMLRKTVKVIFAILGCLMLLYIVETVKLLTTYDIRNPPPSISGKIR